VPDIIYDKGGMGKEPMIRILGKDPEDVMWKLKRIIEIYGVRD
jgi:hydroxymethylpyrimidine/phosphomethylpyrimidine kinase